MDPFELDQAVNNMTILVDTREQPNAKYHRRINSMKRPIERLALSFGDYSAKTTLSDGREVTLEHVAVIERKMSLDEVCGNFGRERRRFMAEFERAATAGARVYLLIENATWTDVFNGNYRSKFGSDALLASMLAWIPRYNTVPIFCKASESGRLIAEIMKRELKEYLTDYDQ